MHSGSPGELEIERQRLTETRYWLLQNYTGFVQPPVIAGFEFIHAELIKCQKRRLDSLQSEIDRLHLLLSAGQLTKLEL